MDRLVDGSLITAAQINDRMGQVRTQINGLATDTVSPYSLTRDHLPTLIEHVKSTYLNPMAVHVYDHPTHPYPGRLSGLSAALWSVVNTNGSAGGGAELAVQFDSDVDLNDSRFKGILVLANVEIKRIYLPAFAAINPLDHFGYFSIQAYKPALGAWWNIPRTERFVQVTENPMVPGDGKEAYMDLPLFAFITKEDVTGPPYTVSKIRVAATLADTSASPSNIEMELLRARLTAFTVYMDTL